MCGIIGYIGEKNAPEVIINGLKRLESRGYDSAGIALVNDDLFIKKNSGKVSTLESSLDYKKFNHYNVGIGHTRWATHGEPNEINAHPHVDCNNEIAIVHNGIIENFNAIKKMLIDKGHTLKSETDTEVIVHIIEYHYRKHTLLDAVMKAIAVLDGTFGLLVISKREPDKIIAARKGSPVLLGLGDDEMIIASDANAVVEHTRKVIYLKDNEIIEIKKDKFRTYTLDYETVDKEVHDIDWDISAIEKQGYDHFMLKEIYEQPESITNAFRGRILPGEGNIRLDGLNLGNDELNAVRRIILIACGTSWHAGLIGEYLLEEYARIPVEVEFASEFRYRKPILNRHDLVIVISQSGETADTLAALREAKSKGAKVLGITNVVGSTIARESDGGVYIHAGPEIGVASTKAFTSQVTVLILLTILMARRNAMSPDEARIYMEHLGAIPEHIRTILDQNDKIKEIAGIYHECQHFFFLGRGSNYPVALEGALKLKEISYIPSQGYPAAEMKHGPIALLDETVPVIFIVTKDELYQKVISSMVEVKARKAKIIAIANQGDDEVEKYADHVIYIPGVRKMLTPLLTVIPLQLLAYHIAVANGCDVDMPRNLAKSVTVE